MRDRNFKDYLFALGTGSEMLQPLAIAVTVAFWSP
jgi:hypothetical protein